MTVRFRTRRNNVDAVYFISGSIRKKMKVEESVNGFDYYSTKVEAGTEKILYFFEYSTEG